MFHWNLYVIGFNQMTLNKNWGVAEMQPGWNRLKNK